ncbi:MAG: four helix bundle protein [Clostridia bacterium]|nr:four helix bundle protein [Clostridia bacterium]
MELVRAAYQIAKLLPREEMFALSEQIRRSAVSIPSNIAEGYGRNSTKDYARFLSIARGSRYELETQLLLCVQLGYVKQQDIENAVDLGEEVGKMLNVIISKLGF